MVYQSICFVHWSGKYEETIITVIEISWCYITLKRVTQNYLFLDYTRVISNMFTYFSSIDDDYLQNASAILDKLKSYYRQGEESSNLSKLLQDYTQVLH